MENSYNIFIINEDSSKSLHSSHPSASNSLSDVQVIVQALDNSKQYSIELWNNGGAVVIS